MRNRSAFFLTFWLVWGAGCAVTAVWLKDHDHPDYSILWGGYAGWGLSQALNNFFDLIWKSH